MTPTTRLTFQTNDCLVEVDVENPRDIREMYARVREEYGKRIADECEELFIGGEYLEE